jgi:hypothetical protein
LHRGLNRYRGEDPGEDRQRVAQVIDVSRKLRKSPYECGALQTINSSHNQHAGGGLVDSKPIGIRSAFPNRGFNNHLFLGKLQLPQ